MTYIVIFFGVRNSNNIEKQQQQMLKQNKPVMCVPKGFTGTVESMYCSYATLDIQSGRLQLKISPIYDPGSIPGIASIYGKQKDVKRCLLPSLSTYIFSLQYKYKIRRLVVRIKESAI